MNDLFQQWGNDLSVDARGDLALVSGASGRSNGCCAGC